MSSSLRTALAGVFFASLISVGCLGELKPGSSGDGTTQVDASLGGDDSADSSDSADDPADSTDQADSNDSSDGSADSADDSADSSDSADDSADDSSDSSDDSADSTDSSDSSDDSSDSSDDGGDGPTDLVWRQARLTHFTSYPAPGSEECEDFNGCTWAGYFAFVDGKQSENWVMMHNIVAVHERDADWLGLKNLRLRMNGDEIDVTVYDLCSDSDCNGCCSNNAAETGFLIDIEKYTRERFGHGDGTVDWACLDCE